MLRGYPHKNQEKKKNTTPKHKTPMPMMLTMPPSVRCALTNVSSAIGKIRSQAKGWAAQASAKSLGSWCEARKKKKKGAMIPPSVRGAQTDRSMEPTGRGAGACTPRHLPQGHVCYDPLRP
ncbi:hypothetical protein VTK26DRAFT_1960 [Humicola hyalothermophila]